MKSVKIAELKDSLSEHLRAVEKGAEVVVSDRNRPIARIVPFEPTTSELSFETPAVPFKAVRVKRFTRLALGRGITADRLLAAERSER